MEGRGTAARKARIALNLLTLGTSAPPPSHDIYHNNGVKR